jgi:ubiquinone biosynthesis protein
MDFRLEAAAAAEYGENLKGDSDFRAPKIDWDRTTREALTMEWIDGLPLSDPETLAARGYDVAKLGRQLIQSFLTHALRDGFFHADMHQGNFLVDAHGRIVALDFGIMGRLEPATRRQLAEMLLGFLTRDYGRVADVFFRGGFLPPDQDREGFRQAVRAIGEPILGLPLNEISMGRLMGHLLTVAQAFEMRQRPELVLLQKTMVVAEGVGRKLNPDVNIWALAQPLVEDWIRDNLGPAARLQDGLARAVAALDRLPDLVALLERRLATGVLVEAEPAEERRWRLLAFVLVLAVGLAIGLALGS